MTFSVEARLSLLSLQLDRVRAADGLIEDALSRYDDGIDEWLEKELGNLQSTDPDDEEYLNELYREQKVDAHAAYPYVLRSALFGTAYGIFEHFMTSLCRDSEPNNRGPRLKDLRGEGIRRAHLYLSKVAGVPVPSEASWTDLVTYGLLRNAIVHAQGDLRDNENVAALEQFQKRAGTFTIREGREAVYLDRGFVLGFVKAVDRFTDDLDSALTKKTHGA